MARDDLTKDGAANGGAQSGLDALVARAWEGAGRGRGLPPVEKWEPDFCGEIDMVIAADGTWFYQGTPIGRPALVRLFSTVLRKDADGRTYLVTPVEKLAITVEDAAFLAVEMQCETRDDGPVLTFRTTTGDVIEAGHDHALRFSLESGMDEVKPYLHVRGRLEALVSRAVMYELVERGEDIEIDGRTMFAVRSGGAVFPIMARDTLDALAQ
ncbi:DUF1285 domain-containing protein [Pararhizobium mangrovi]|uniref:DUF1285 domain-containing protein n=1 Tax=Pararhizobium mangrovi TaxID=2590452 RepID=A0A506UHU1_9HYPH|nr:DUF1285 domain-containing protein [Pararhizobium mangrovi]TPW32870.1 DUF1285 domain-containing protein [Pararhizobium mangrovi]